MKTLDALTMRLPPTLETNVATPMSSKIRTASHAGRPKRLASAPPMAPATIPSPVARPMNPSTEMTASARPRICPRPSGKPSFTGAEEDRFRRGSALRGKEAPYNSPTPQFEAGSPTDQTSVTTEMIIGLRRVSAYRCLPNVFLTLLFKYVQSGSAETSLSSVLIRSFLARSRMSPDSGS